MIMDEKKIILDRKEILEKLRGALIERLQIDRDPDELDPDVALFGSGFGLDSLDAVELVVFLETEFGVKISEDTPFLLSGSMRTMNTLTDLVLASGSKGSNVT